MIFPPNKCRTIIATVSESCGVPVEGILSARRTMDLAAVRHAAMWMCSQVGATCGQIGMAFNRDPTTVLHGIRKVNARRESDPDFKHETDRIMERAREALGGR